MGRKRADTKDMKPKNKKPKTVKATIKLIDDKSILSKDELDFDRSKLHSLPLLPVRDIVIFPYMVIPLIIGRKSSISAVEHALSDNQIVFVTCQRLPDIEEPAEGELFKIGTVAKILRIVRLPDNKIKILIQGLYRAELVKFEKSKPFITVKINELKDKIIQDDLATEAKLRLIRDRLTLAVDLGKPILPDLLAVVDTIDDPSKLTDIIAANLGLKLAETQDLLESGISAERLDKLNVILNKEISILEVQQKIFSDAKSEIDKGQRDFFLREQLKAIKRELGDEDLIDKESDEYKRKIRKAKMPKDVKTEALKQVSRLLRMHQDSAEANVIRGYLDLMTELPWGISTDDNIAIKTVTTVLDEDHYGLEEVKDRVIDFLALRKLNKKMKSPILCLVGPPGVGKTSLGRSVARAMNRKFYRISMGGVRDEAEIRGHRRTYIGAMPGKIIQGLKTAGTNNPVLMLDEIDKIGADFRGDPAAALLEVLDPVQNATFTDHYLALPFDLSNVLFITTANVLDTIPLPLQDRMEVITIPGYTEEEKLIIAKQYIIDRQIEENGLTKADISISDDAVKFIIDGYTRESGLRGLEQMIGKVCRKVGRYIVEERDNRNYKAKRFKVEIKEVEKYLGAVKYIREDELKINDIGIVTGLAWTAVGGEVLFVECSRFAGKGDLILTGMLGDVMKESSRAALSFVKTIASKYNVDEDAFTKYDYHIHLPAGAIPKDGPSAGITMATALLSRVLGKAVRKDIAMTGEITITGKVLPIGGLKEKILAAKRIGAKSVIIPKKNENEISKLPKYVTDSIKIIPVEEFTEVAKIAIIDKDK